MKSIQIKLLSAAAFLAVQVLNLHAQGTAFTYQGALNNGGSPANGSYDFAFTLYTTNVTGGAVAGPVTNSAVAVTNGLFTTLVNFGNAFSGGSNWLEVAVSTNGANAFTTLTPRQQFTPVPYALLANGASNVLGTVSVSQLSGNIPAGQISGTVALTNLPATVVTNGASGVSLGGTFSGNGAGLTNLNATQITSGTLPAAQLPAGVVTNGASGATINGTFTGNGTGITNLNLTSINGISTSVAPYQTNYYTTTGTYNITVPTNATKMIVKLWGAAGGSQPQFTGTGLPGGGGAYVMVTLTVSPGDTYVAVVGQHGGGGPGLGGGIGQNNASGGGGNSAYGCPGGQGSSIFKYVNPYYIMKAVAGGGGGGGNNIGAAGGNPGQGPGGALGGYNGAGGSGYYSGYNYSANALTIGETNLNLMNGDGGNASPGGSYASQYSGGGGGYGGGGGAGGLSPAAGGGSYGDVIVGGNFAIPGNTNDPSYVYPAGMGVTNLSGNDGLIVVIFEQPITTLSTGLAVNGPLIANNGTVLNGPITVGGAMTFTGVAPLTNNNAFWSQGGFYESDRGGPSLGAWAYYGHNQRAYLWSSVANADRFSVDTNGNVRAAGTFTASTSPDLAETISAAENVEAGDIVSADPGKPESAVRCSKDAPAVLGVISDGSGGFLINARGNAPDALLTGKPLVLVGRVPVKVSLENGPIKIGDELAPSSTPGVAMRATDSATMVGIALAPFDGRDTKAGIGKVLCFVKVEHTGEINMLKEQNKLLQERLDDSQREFNARLEKLEQLIGRQAK